MAFLLVKHSVEDYEAWKKFFDGNSEFRRTHGSVGGRLFQTFNDTNEVLVLAEFDNIENAKKFADAPELKAVMQDAGVTSQPEISFLNEAGSFAD